MKKRVISILFWGLALHLVVSAAFIFHLPFFSGTRLSTLYKTYLLPGPFFTDSRIVDNYSLSLSWKIAGRWIPEINPAKENFDRYHASLNVSELYRSRFSRTLFLSLPLSDSSVTNIQNRKEFQLLKQFLYDQYVPNEADSVRMWIINNRAENLIVRTDSVYIAISR